MYENLLANVPTDLWIGGKWRKASDGGRFDVIDPATESKVASVASATVDDAKAAVDAANRHATDVLAAYQQEYPGKLQFVYGPLKYVKPFLVRSIWNDGQFTYIKADATELPALYEVKDGKPALVNFQVQNGTYIVPKVLDHGYLSLGKERFEFPQQGR